MSVSPDPPAAPVLRRVIVAFGRFWWEFLVGDTPELLLGTVAAVGLVALIVHHGAARAVGVVFLPVLVVAMLGASVARARRSARRNDREPASH